MTATDELCRLLNEAGVEYKVTSCHLCSSTEWECDLGNAVFYEDHTNGYTRVTIHYKDGMTHFQITSDLKPPERYVTPEQAIAATLGRDNARKYVGLRRGEYWERTENSDYYCGGCGWKVTDHDSYCPECGGALHKATLGHSFNCTNSERNSERTTMVDETDTWECVCDGIGRYGKRITVHVMECSECGHTYEHVNGDYEFCPRCGCRIVEVDE